MFIRNFVSLNYVVRAALRARKERFYREPLNSSANSFAYLGASTTFCVPKIKLAIDSGPADRVFRV